MADRMRLAFWLMLGLVISAAGTAAAFATTTSGPPPPGDPAAATAVIARRGDASVSLADIDAYVDVKVPEKDRFGFMRNGDRILNLVGSILLTKQLDVEARQHGIDRDPLIAPQLAGKTGYDAELALAKLWLERYPGTLDVPDFTELARETYQLSPSHFVEKGSVDVRQVVITSNGRGDEAAKALADKIYKQAVADPDQFGALITKYSDDPNKKETRGVMENMGAPRYTSELRDAALALAKVGDISKPVKTTSGYQILQLIKRTNDRQKSFDEVSEQMTAALREDWLAKQVKKHSDELSDMPLRDVNKELLLSLQTRYGKASGNPEPATATSK